jgi:hypothetical protein
MHQAGAIPKKIEADTLLTEMHACITDVLVVAPVSSSGVRRPSAAERTCRACGFGPGAG